MRTILCLLVLSVSIHAEEPAKPTVTEQAEIKKLLTQTKDYEPNNREKACVLLASYGSKAMEVVPRLKEMIEKDLNGSARLAALGALCEIDLKSASPVLNKEALGSAFPAVRVSALQLLAIHEPEDKGSYRTAKAAMKDRNNEVVCAACLTLAMHKLRTEDDFNSATAELTRRTMEKKPEPATLALLQIKAIELLNPKKPTFLSLVEYSNLTIRWELSRQEYSQKLLESFVKAHTEVIVTDMLVSLTRNGDSSIDRFSLDMMDTVLKQSDLPKVYEQLVSLDTKKSDDGKLRVVLDRLMKAGTMGLDVPLHAAVQKPTLPMSKILLSVASQRELGMLVSEEDVSKLIQYNDATTNEFGLRFAVKIRSAILTKAALAKVYPANSDNAKFVAAVFRDYATTLSEKKEPTPATVTLLKSTWTHPNEEVRGLGIATSARIGLLEEKDVLEFIQSADSTLNDPGLRFAIGKQSELLTKAALAKVYPANSDHANLVAAVYRDYTSTLSEKKEPAASTVTLLKSSWAHPNEDVRGIGVAASARTGVLAKAPLDELRPLLIDKNSRVQGYAFTMLADKSKTDAKAKLLLDKLAESKDEDVKLMAKLSRAGTLKPDATPTAGWLLDEDTTAIVDMQVRSILDFLPIKNRLNKKLRDELKQSPLIRQFEFDPLTELNNAQFAISETRDSTALLTGNFKQQRLRTPFVIEGGNDSYAQFLNDTTLLLATTKPKLEDIIRREFKPLKLAADKQPLISAIPAKPTGSVIWMASRWPSFFVNGDLLRTIGIEAVDPALLKSSPIFLITLDIEKTEVVFRWTVPSVNADDQVYWKAYLEKWADAYKTFAPLVGAQMPQYKSLIAESSKTIGVKIEEKKAVVLSFRVSITAVDEALDVLGPGADR